MEMENGGCNLPLRAKHGDTELADIESHAKTIVV